MHSNPIGALEKPRFLILITFEPYLSSLIEAHARGQIKEKWEYIQLTEFANRYVNIQNQFGNSFRSVVVITSASHAEGRRFEPGRKHSLLFLSLTSVAAYSKTATSARQRHETFFLTVKATKLNTKL